MSGVKHKQVTLRCDDGSEAVVFTEYTFSDGEINYEITVEDSYKGKTYRGLLGRLQRAWAMFKERPVIYTGIFTEDTDKIKKFLNDCLTIMNEAE